MTTSGEPDSLDEVLCDYLDRLDQGEPVDRAALRARHPQLAQELARFFDDWDAVSQAVHDVRNEALPRENQERDRAGLHQC